MSVHLHRCPVEGCREIVVDEAVTADRQEEPATEARAELRRWLDVLYEREIVHADVDLHALLDRAIEREAQGEQPAPLDVERGAIRKRTEEIATEFREDDDENGYATAVAHIAMALAQAEARLPFHPDGLIFESMARTAMRVVERQTPLSPGQPLVDAVTDAIEAEYTRLSNQPSTEPAQGGTG